MKKTIKISLVSIALSCQFIYAQVGVSSGSVSLVRSNGFGSTNEKGNLNERSVIVEDFMNFHKHNILIPTQADVALSVDYDNKIAANSKEFILQIGLATKNAKIQDRQNQVNVSLVLDCSGSMDGFKIEKVKSAMKKFVEGLDDNDILSIISFDDRAKVVLGAKKIGNDKTQLYKMIDGIYGGGSTNINDGMMFGYQEALKNHSKNINSRVILLTDGMTNSGETNPEKIILNSKTYNDKGIEISTIGVGDQLDFDLLRQLSDAGNGSNYFIGENEEDIQKTFVDELQSLLFQIGKRPKVIIELPKNFKIKEFYGYQPQFLSDNKVSVNIENLNSGVTQIFLLKVEKVSDANTEIKVQLSYSKNDKNIIIEENKRYNPKIESTNNELKKNYQIALMASNLKKASAEYSKNNLGNADSLIKETIDYIQLNSDLKDKDINRLFSILKRLDTKRPVNY
ncbi:VWA domain-containing protein [Flavobacterium procerum]|uniref:VWA domain-containing protein n=1 Tax=Flavobacterium procerum TaxID=1455569 RepID=A0ABV6BLS7_9FLAO